jgi:hypothetical protein
MQMTIAKITPGDKLCGDIVSAVPSASSRWRSLWY